MVIVCDGTDEAAERTLDGLLNTSRFEVAFPRRMAWILKLLRSVPYPLAFWVTDKMMPR